MPQNHPNESASRPAFSLLELTMVLAIMGIAGAMAVPRYSGYLAKSHLNAAVTRITTDLEQVRRTAKQTGTSQSVVFSVGQDSYAVTGWKSMDRKSVAHTVPLSQEPYMAQIVSASFVDGKLTFNGYGEPDAAGSILIQVGSYQRQIDVSIGTGFIIHVFVPG